MTLWRLHPPRPAAAALKGGGRYFGFVTGGTLPVALAADWLAAAWDQNGWNEVTSPGAAAFEGKAVAGLLTVLGLPAAAQGVLCSGATGANIIALATARDAVLAAAGWDVDADGLIGAPPITIYPGAEAHSSVYKALGVVGLGRRGSGRHVIQLATNPQGAVEYVTFRPNFHHFDHFELDLCWHIHMRGAAFSCLRLKLADIVLI